MKEVKNIIDSKYHFNDYELKKNFDEAYKDDTFKNIVNKIKLPKEELIKYIKGEFYRKDVGRHISFSMMINEIALIK